MESTMFLIVQTTGERCTSRKLLYYVRRVTVVCIAIRDCNLSIKGCSVRAIYA
jgi:hypothetical protein